MRREELRTAILYFDISRAKTSLNAVHGVITREQAEAYETVVVKYRVKK